MSDNIIPLTKQKIPTILSMDESMRYTIGDKARSSGIKGVTNVFSFKEIVGSSDSEYEKTNRYWIAPSGDTKKSKTFSAKQATNLFLKSFLEYVDELPDSLIIGQPSSTDEKWRQNYRKHIREEFSDLGFDNIDFWYEPFAVFQYYTQTLEEFSKPGKEELILIIDVGGGTFNSSIIHTTESGDLSRGGAKSVPYGLQSEFVGGHVVDQELIKLLVDKAKKRGIVFKDEDYLERIQKRSPKILLQVEEAKINLSVNADKSNQSHCYRTVITIAPGELHPTEAISEELTCIDLESIVTQCWKYLWFPIIEKTILSAKENQKIEIDKIDRILIAGGSSQLPNMKHQAFKCLSTLVNIDDIYIGENCEASVATGIAIECMERAARDPKLAVNHLANCMTNDLFFGIRQSRREYYSKLKVNCHGEINKDGQLLSTPMESNDFELEFEITSPFDIGDKLFFGFCKQPLLSNDPITLNSIPQDVISIPRHGKKVKRNFNLRLSIAKDGLIKPEFCFHSRSRKNPEIKIKAPDFYFDDLKIQEGATYIGIDFGNSNSYISKYIAVNNNFSISEYPRFSSSKNTKARLLKLEDEIIRLKEKGDLSPEKSITSLNNKRLSLIYNSNKIEGNRLSLGETQSVVKNEEIEVDEVSRQEVINLEEAYKFVEENYKSLFDSPERYIRELHRTITQNILKDPGQYRNNSVKISGVDFVPPQSGQVPYFMEQLGREIRSRGQGRSIAEFVAAIHTAFTMIHPFEDGNGRTARALISSLLIDYGFPQIVLKIDDRSRYMSALEKSNSGDLSNTINLFADLIQREIDILQKRKSKNVNIKKSIEKPVDKLDLSKLEEAVNRDEEVLLDFGKFEKALYHKESEVRLKSEYKQWSASFENFYAAFTDVCNQLNSTYKNKNISISIEKFDNISYETYQAFQNGESFIPTWYFIIKIKWRGSSSSILFSFSPRPEDVEAADGDICLLISAAGEIDEQPVPIPGTEYKYACSVGQKVKFFPGQTTDSLDQSIVDFLADALNTL